MYHLLLTSWAFKLNTASAISVSLPLFVGIIFFKKHSVPLRYIVYLLLATVLVEVAARVLIVYKQPNLPLLHIYTPLQFALIAWVYQLYLHKIYPRYLIPIVILIFSAYSLINSLFIQSIFTFNTYARAIENILLIILALSYFYKMLRELKVKYLEKHPMFWINSGVLIYFSGSLFIFIFSNYILPSQSLSQFFWIIHAFLNIFINIFYAIGLWLSRENSE